MDRGEEEPEELFLFFEAEEKFPLEEKTSSVHELMTMVGSADIVENNPPLSPILEKVAAEKGGPVSGVDGLETEPKTFHCNHCDSTFNSQKGLTIHTGRLHKAEEAFQSTSDTSTSVAPAPTWSPTWSLSTDALKRKADFQPNSSEQQSKRSKNNESKEYAEDTEGDGEYVEDTEEEKEVRTTYPHNFWPQVKLEPLGKFPYLLGWQVQNNNIMKHKLGLHTSTLEQLQEEKRCLEVKMKQLIDQFKEEREKNEQLTIEMEQIHEEKTKVEEQLDQELENLKEEKAKGGELKNKLDAMEEELVRTTQEKADLQKEINMSEELSLQNFNRLKDLDGTLKGMLKNYFPEKVAQNLECKTKPC